MAMVIQHMLTTQIAVDKQKNSLSKLKKASERLSSGYRINRSADDAAGLAVSEKLRSIRRGLRQGLRNIEDGIGFVRTVEGASQEIHNMLHRLRELAVQSCNGTYDDDVDREAMDLEYQEILDEIDQITDNADFNGVPLFEKHLSAFEMNEGDVCHNGAVTIDSQNDTLVLGYTIGEETKEYTVNIPHGTYSAEETADIIDSILFTEAPELIIGINTENQFTLQAEGGKIDHISGSAASLFYNTVIGSKDGYLLGVTVFTNEDVEMRVYDGENDTIAFRVGNSDDTLYSIKLDAGYYNRMELIDAINTKLTQAGVPGNVKAVPDKNGKGQLIIGLSSDDTITGLAGNFIKIDGKTSPIYDICQYGDIDNSQAVLSATKRLEDNLVIERGRNDYFVLNLKYYGDDASQKTASIKVNLLGDGENLRTYARPADLVNEIQKQLDDAGHPFDVAINSRGALEITSRQYGDKCSVKLNTSDVPSAYMIHDLFEEANLVKVQPKQETSTYTRAIFTSAKKLDSEIYIPASENTLSFDILVSEDNEAASSAKTTHRVDVVIPEGSYTRQELVQKMNDYLDNNYPDIADKLQFSIDGSNVLKLYAEGTNGSMIEKIQSVSSSTAYNRLIGGSEYYKNIKIENGSEEAYASASQTVPGSGGRQNVSTVSGSTIQGTSEAKEQNPTSQSSAAYITYSKAGFTPTDGVTIYDTEEDVVGAIKSESPAKLFMDEVLTQFSLLGKSEKDLNLSFELQDSDGSHSYSIDIPKGSTAAQAVNIIKDKIKDRATVSTSGNDITITTNDKGKDMKFTAITGSLLNKATKSSLANRTDAVIDDKSNMVYIPSKLVVKNALSRIPYTIDGSNDRLMMTAGMHSYDLRLTHKTYTSLAEMAEEINAQLSAADGGTAATTAAVGADGKSLVFTGPAKESGTVSIDDASSCRIGYTLNKVNTSDPYYNPATGNIEKPATMRAEGIATHFPATVDSTNNTITMKYTSPKPGDPSTGVTENLTITIPDGTYNNATEFTAAINSAIAADPSLNGKITASYNSSGSNKGLTFTTVNGGKGYELSSMGGTFGADKYISKADTTGGALDEGANVIRFPATAVNNKYGTLFNGSGIEINDNNNHVSLSINGTTYEFQIANGVYQGASGRADLTSQLRDALATANVTVTDSGGTLSIVTNEGGNGKTIGLNADNTAPYFMGANAVSAPTSTARKESPCYIVGANNCSSIEIKDYANSMTFDFTQDGTTHQVTVEINAGSYTAETLAQAIQESINKTLPANSLKVSATRYGNIEIKSATITPIRKISNFEGGLFDKVFQNANYNTVKHRTETVGTSTGSYMTYIVGRNNLQPETADELISHKNVIIYPALNDQLIFDLKYNGTTYKVEFEIPAGQYTPEELAAVIRDTGRATLNAMTDVNGEPFPQDAFNATIGLSALGLSEPDTSIKSTDKLVLSFAVPDDGTVEDTTSIIDGVRGNAAYRIFYEATQAPTPSKVIGKADLTDGIMITAGENDTFSYCLDGTEYSVTIPEGSYTCDQIYQYLNSEYEAMGSMVRCTNMNGHLMFYTIENGDYDIDTFTGNAADDLFYGGESRESDSEIGIHIGRRTDTYIWYMRTRVDDHLMRINTTGVTTAARAAKALERVDAAVNYLSRWRALSGANENRSRHSYERNQEYIANLEQADSTLRDADIAHEVSELAKQQILIQAQNAMIEQSKQQQSSIMDVLA